MVLTRPFDHLTAMREKRTAMIKETERRLLETMITLFRIDAALYKHSRDQQEREIYEILYRRELSRRQP
jgi:selenophosphate synthase